MCVTCNSKVSDQIAGMRRLVLAFAVCICVKPIFAHCSSFDILST